MAMRFNGDLYPKLAEYRHYPRKSISEKAILSHALLFITKLPGLKAHKKHETTIYCATFFLDSQGYFLYTSSTKKQGFITLPTYAEMLFM